MPDVWVALSSLEIAGEQLMFPPGQHGGKEGDSYALTVSDTNPVIMFALAGQHQRRITDQMPLYCPRDPVLLDVHHPKAGHCHFGLNVISLFVSVSL